jgi:pimeloyl-ACP methyl ester carboxylesterase
MDALGVSHADFVTHDIGNMVGYALVAGCPNRVTRFVPIDAPLPGVGPGEQIIQDSRM